MAVFGPFFGGADPAPALEQARTAAKRALELDGTLAEAYNARAMVEVRADYAWPEAERDYQRSITLHPNFSETHENYALELGALGRFSDALREIDWAEKLEPDNSHFRSAHGLILYMARRYDRSLSILSEIAKTPGGVSRVAAPMTMNYWVKSQPDEALKILEQMPTDTTPELRVPLLATAYARLGQRERAEQLLRDLDLPGKKAWWYYLAIAHLNLGRRDEAVEDLQRAYRERWGDVVWIGVEPMFDPLRSNPGFRRLMETLKLSSGTAAKG
jgi:tetratricopeptide (TPR) repeat protein